MVSISNRQDGFPKNFRHPKRGAIHAFQGACRGLVYGLKLREESGNSTLGANLLKENSRMDFARRKYPPPRIWKYFLVQRDFPVGCRNQNFGHLTHLANRKDFPVQRDFPVGCGNQNFGHLTNLANGKSMIDIKPSEVIRGIDFDRNKIKKALHSFHEMHYKLVQKDLPSASSNIHIRAAMVLRRQFKWINTSKQLGAIPGVEMGDKFHWRAELNVIGLHCQFESGIDYMKIDGKILATSIVASGRYSNDVESIDILIYSGQGGNPSIRGNQHEDQKLERGNLALKNSMEAKTPIRVIRGFTISKSSTFIGMSGRKLFKKMYVYDGLYFVDRYWQERGQFGKLVFMFALKRISTQSENNCARQTLQPPNHC